MSWRTLRGVVLMASAATWFGTATAGRAWARKAPKAAPKEERQEAPEAPPPSFVAPPPGYEPPPPFSPGDPAPPLPPYEEPMPGFFTLDRADANSRAGFQGGWNKIADVGLGDAFATRLEAFGQFILPSKAGGFYGQLPLVHRFNFGAADATALGNLEVGGIVLPYRRSDLILRAGIAAGTASDNLAAQDAAYYERLTDYVLTRPSTTTLRASASTLRQLDIIFLRGDLGLDVVLNKPDADPTNVYGRANIALGARAAGLDFTFELVNLARFNGGQGGVTNYLMHTGALSVRTPGVDQFHLGIVMPLDGPAFFDAFIATLGYQRIGFF
jgi:hypothetical protein